jgi:hypothetical protein
LKQQVNVQYIPTRRIESFSLNFFPRLLNSNFWILTPILKKNLKIIIYLPTSIKFGIGVSGYGFGNYRILYNVCYAIDLRTILFYRTKMLFKGLVTILACDFLFVILSIPLILRKVPRNVVYGFRTRATLTDDFVWFEANAHFGRGLLLSSIFSAGAMVVLYFSNLLPLEIFIKASLGVLVVPPIVPVLLTFCYIKSITQSNR